MPLPTPNESAEIFAEAFANAARSRDRSRKAFDDTMARLRIRFAEQTGEDPKADPLGAETYHLGRLLTLPKFLRSKLNADGSITLTATEAKYVLDLIEARI
jgi:hypothetical protein